MAKHALTDSTNTDVGALKRLQDADTAIRAVAAALAGGGRKRIERLLGLTAMALVAVSVGWLLIEKTSLWTWLAVIVTVVTAGATSIVVSSWYVGHCYRRGMAVAVPDVAVDLPERVPGYAVWRAMISTRLFAARLARSRATQQIGLPAKGSSAMMRLDTCVEYAWAQVCGALVVVAPHAAESRDEQSPHPLERAALITRATTWMAAREGSEFALRDLYKSGGGRTPVRWRQDTHAESPTFQRYVKSVARSLAVLEFTPTFSWWFVLMGVVVSPAIAIGSAWLLWTIIPAAIAIAAGMMVFVAFESVISRLRHRRSARLAAVLRRSY